MRCMPKGLVCPEIVLASNSTYFKHIMNTVLGFRINFVTMGGQ